MTTKKTPRLLLSVLDNYGGHPFDEVFDLVMPIYAAQDVRSAYELTKQLAIVIWGGADISPSIYDQKPNRWTGAEERMSSRDAIEVSIAKQAIELGIPI